MSFEIAAWSVKKSLLDFIYTVVEAYLSVIPSRWDARYHKQWPFRWLFHAALLFKTFPWFP